MNHRYIAGGQLAWGFDNCPKQTVINGKTQGKSPRFCGGYRRPLWGLYMLRRVKLKPGGIKRFLVLNFTHPRFSIGFTTSGGLGLLCSTDSAKRGGKDGDTHTVFRGVLAQLGFYFAKVYLYLYFNRDGITR